MKCDICGKKSDKGTLIMGEGFCCSPPCAEKATERRKKFHAELLAEELTKMPGKVDVPEFERWSLKLAIQMLRGMSEATRAKLREGAPFMLVPEQLALDLKERILRHIHKAYVSEVRAKGHERLFHGGTYCFRQPVPSKHILEAAVKAEILKAS